MYIVSPPAL